LHCHGKESGTAHCAKMDRILVTVCQRLTMWKYILLLLSSISCNASAILLMR
jgi:hypothetical protein